MPRLGNVTEGRYPINAIWPATCVVPLGDVVQELRIVSTQVRLANDGCVGNICFLDKPKDVCPAKGGSRDGIDRRRLAA